MAMKKDKKTGGTDKRYVSSLEKKVAKLESEVGYIILNTLLAKLEYKYI